MPNALTPTGVTIAPLTEIVSNLDLSFQNIYGADIDLSSSSPDGQAIAAFAQAVVDVSELILNVYNSFDPDQAFGVTLDQRVAFNGIQRQAGTYTVTNITVATSQSVNLYGLDQIVQPVYTVSDAAGNKYQLQSTVTGFNPGAGGSALSFEAANPGAIVPTPNTITVPVTVVIGVTSVNNPTVATTIGVNEETDAALRVRRQQSVSIASQGYLAGLLADLKNLSGMIAVFIYENDTDTTNSDGVPGHSIWVITSGTATAATIAQAIYNKRSAGCGMYGANTYAVTQADGSLFDIFWDSVSQENLFIKFTATSLDGVNVPNVNAIRTNLPTSYVPGVNEEVDVNGLATKVQTIDPNCLVTNAGFSTSASGSYTNTLSPTSKKYQFEVASANIIILPIVVVPNAANVVTLTTQAFAAYGGYGTYTWTINVNNSGGSINSSTGLYTAGASTGVTDTVRVTDALSNFTDTLVSVVP